MSSYALEFLILSAMRTGAIIQAQWQEIDFKEKVWNISAEHMKMKKPHRVPLYPHAMELLIFLHANAVNNFIFVGQSKGGGLSNAAIYENKRRL